MMVRYKEWSSSEAKRRSFKMRGIGSLMQGAAALIALTFLTGVVWGESRISGTYVAHSDGFVCMLQLTQTDNGQLAGVVSEIKLDAAGKIDSSQGHINGAIDGGQVTLSLVVGPFSETSMAGTVKGAAIELQRIGSNGDLQSWMFERASASEFQTYADHLENVSAAIKLTENLVKRAQEAEETTRRAATWAAEAEIHLARVQSAKEHYQKD